MKKQQTGFIQLIIIIILLIIILSLLGVSLQSLFSNPTLKENFGFVGEWLSKLWHSYLTTPFRYLYRVFVDVVWTPILDWLSSFRP